MIVNLYYNLFNRRTQILFVTVAEAVPFVLLALQRKKWQAEKEERQRYIYSNLFLMSPFFLQPTKPRWRDELRGRKLNL